VSVDHTALGWLRDEIAESLGQAKDALERYAEGSGELDHIHNCAEILHQIGGVLGMLGLRGVSLLTDEMESLARELVHERVALRGDACHQLMRGIAQLPEYIEFVRTDNRDNPLLLEPLLNDLRGVRGAAGLSKNFLFSPELWAPLPPAPSDAVALDDETLRAEAARLRAFFQRGLVGWFRDAPPAEGIALITAVIFRTFVLVGVGEARRLWWVAAGVATALRHGELEVSPVVKRLVGRLDGELKRLVEEGEGSLGVGAPEELLKQLLYYVALASSDEGPNPAIREAFRLDGLLLHADQRSDAAGALAGPGAEALRNVAGALRNDLSGVTDSLDTFVRDEGSATGALVPHSDTLHRIAGTLGVLKLAGPRRSVLDQAAAIRRFGDERSPPTDEELIEVARALVTVDKTLEHLGAQGVVEPGSASDDRASLTGVEWRLLLCAVLVECEAELTTVKDAIASFVADPDEYEGLTQIPARLGQVVGGLRMLSLARAADALQRWHQFVQATFINKRSIPHPDALDAFADTIVNLEGYFEAVRAARPDADTLLGRVDLAVCSLDAWWPDSADSSASGPVDVPLVENALDVDATQLNPAIPEGLLEDLQRAKDLLERLDDDYVAPPSERSPTSTQSAAASATDVDDPEILRVFVEEAARLQADLAECVSALASNAANAERLVTLRRHFHSLKGSGHAVGAALIAEFAWAIENLLNRVIEKLVPHNARITGLIEEACVVLPDLVSAFVSPGVPPPDIKVVVERAEELGRAQAPATGLERIVAEEAKRHLEALEELLGTASNGDAELAASLHAPLMRIVSALHAGADAAGVVDIATLTGELEVYLASLRQAAEDGRYQPRGTIGMTLVHDCCRALREAIDTLGVGGDGAVIGMPALLTRIGVLSGSLTTAPESSRDPTRTLPAVAERFESPAEDLSSPEPTSGSARVRLTESVRGVDHGSLMPLWDSPDVTDDEDDELRGLFLDEALELLESADAALIQWIAHPEQLETVASFHRKIHTLKGGARLAGLDPVGDLAHALESVLMLVGQRSVLASEPLYELLQRANDRLGSALDRVRAGESLPDMDPVIRELDGFVGGQVADARLADGNMGPLDDELDAGATKGAVDPAADVATHHERISVGAELLVRLESHAGEISIAHSQIDRAVSEVHQNLKEMERTIDRLHDQLARLAIETRSQRFHLHKPRHYGLEPAPGSGDVDPEAAAPDAAIVQLSHALAESVQDLSSIQSSLEGLTRDSQASLSRQADATNELQQGLLHTRMLPISRLTPRLHRIVRETARELGKSAELVVEGDETRIDRAVLGRVQAPLEHMLRNAVDHGIEPPATRARVGKNVFGRITLSIYGEGHEVVIEVSDDGKGFDRGAIRGAAIQHGLLEDGASVSDDTLFRLTLEPALSTAQGVTQISGRGVGMDVVNTEVRALGGSVQIVSDPGTGTTIKVCLPFTLSVSQVFLVSASGGTFAIPLQFVEAVVRLRPAEVDALLDTPGAELEHGGSIYRFVPLTRLLDLPNDRYPSDAAQIPVVFVRSGEGRMAVLVDTLSGRQELVVKSLGRQLAVIGWYAGAAILGDGKVVLVLDVPALTARELPPALGAGVPTEPTQMTSAPPTILVVDDSITARRVTDRLLTRNGMRVVTARDGLEALAALRDTTPDLMLLDIEMPRMDGFEVVQALRDNPHAEDLPVIVISTHTGVKHTERARQIGVDKYLGKPFDERELLETINAMLSR